MSIEQGKIYIFHLVNNTTLVGLVQSQTEDGYVIEKPMELFTGPGNNGPKGALIPYLSMGLFLPPLETFPLTYDLILLPRTPSANLETAYREQTGMIAVPATKSLIIPN